MKIIRILSIFVVLATFSYSAFCQESFGGRPLSETRTSLSLDVPVWELPATTPLDEVKGETHDKGQALRIGRVEPVKLSMSNAGRTDRMANGDIVWRLGFHSEGAFAMNLSFSKFNIPEGAELYVYNADRSFTIGKFTSANTMDGNIFFTQDVAGDLIYIEYFEPHNAAFEGTIEIEDVGICERNLFGHMKGAIGDAVGDCHIDVTCPEAAGWTDQINSVVCYTFREQGYTYMCSGAMINNTKQDRRPYVFTAAHCYSAFATNYVFYFNYQTYACGGNYGNYSNTATGATKRAMGDIEKSSDFLLLEITGALSPSWRDKVYFAGWDRSTNTPTTGIAIHHPGGDWKKVSIPKSVGKNNLRAHFWEVSWITGSNNKGTTEQGSSGSPLFNASKRIVGSLSHGTSSCEYEDEYAVGPVGKDYYGQLAWSWTNNNTSSSAAKLQPWLAPGNASIMSLNGIYYSDATQIDSPETQTPTIKIFPNPTDGHLTLQGEFKAHNGTVRLFNLLGELVYTQDVNIQNDIILNIDGVEHGIYIIELLEGDNIHRNKLIITR